MRRNYVTCHWSANPLRGLVSIFFNIFIFFFNFTAITLHLTHCYLRWISDWYKWCLEHCFHYFFVFVAPPSVQMRKKNSPTSSPTANKKDRKAGKPGELTAGQNRRNLVPGLCLPSFRLCLAPEDGRKKEKHGYEFVWPKSTTLISNN